MDDDRPRAPTYGHQITIPEFLGRIAYHAWFEADLSRPAVDWMELSEAERHLAPSRREGRRADPHRDRAQSRARQLPAAPQVPGQASGPLHPLHLLPLGPTPSRPRHRRRGPPL